MFAICLVRYSGQASIPLAVTIHGATRSLELEANATCTGLIAQISDQLRGAPRTARREVAAITCGPSAGSTADLHLITSGEGAAVVYNTLLFKPTTVERFAGHITELLASVAMQLTAPIGALSFIPPAEQAWLDAVAVGRVRGLPDALVHQQIERHARDTPEAIAVRHGGDHLTYAELNRLANQLAHELIARAGSELRIAVCVEPSFDIAIALLGILKAGAVYVPIDPTYPAARIRAILADTQPVLVVSRDHLIERLGLSEFPTFVVGRADRGPVANLDLVIDPAQTAYVYFTSGTTGAPKGVMASQRNLSTYIDAAVERYAITRADVMPAIARFSFSISMFELAAPLVAGGTLILLDRDHVLDPARMARTLAEVTIFHAGPSLLKHLLPYLERQHPDRAMFAGVRHASSGGDMIAPELLESLKRIFTAAEVFVIYGCSEISCMGCTYPVPRDRVVTRTYVGRPFDNVTVRVLDPAGRQAPIGVVGEIHFAGGGVVMGYLGRPDLTAEKFVELAGDRFYRTGDMGRTSDEGWLEILGRNDFQIKVRGMRIELGEVEFNLRRAPGVRDAVVMAKAVPDAKIMVGYIVFGDTADPDPDARMLAIRRHMVDTVPDYMVPAMYVELAALPLNLNMKVDRHALPDPVGALLRVPETETETRLATLWQAVLGVAQVGLDDNFFQLGADSLLAVELIVRAADEFALTIDGMDLLRESLEVVAAICDRRRGAPSAKSRPQAQSRASAPLEIFHFGPDASLYGVLHGTPAPEAVLVCAPPGQERARAQFVLDKLARGVAARGTPVMLFDWYGLGDSAGDSVDATVARWQHDVVAAHAELARRTGATRIAAVGVRFGAALLASVLDRVEVAQLVLWDPIYSGAELLADHGAMHQRYLRGTSLLRRARLRFAGGADELVGVTYSAAMLQELRRLAVTRITDVPVRCLATHDVARQRRAPGGGALEVLDVACAWRDMARFEEMIPDLGIVPALTRLLGVR